VRQHYVNLGEQKGVQSEQAASAQENEQSRSQERRDVIAEIGTLHDQIAAIDARGAALVTAVAKSVVTSQSIEGQRNAAVNTVAEIPAQSLHAANLRTLQGHGVAGAGDSQGGAAYGEAEERAIAACLVDRPLCQKQNVVLKAANADLQQELAGVEKARSLEQQQYNSLAGYTGELEHSYVQLYNAVPKRRNWIVSIVTLGMAGRPKKLAVPSVEELRRGSGKDKAGS
jgi:hypothetical protein